MTIFHKIIASSLCLCIHTALASSYPRGCEVTGFNYNENQLVLNEKGDQTFYLIQNRSNIQVELERIQDEDVFMSPKLTTKLSPNRYAAFASDIVNMRFQCFKQNLSERERVDCAEVLEICQYPRAKFPLSNMGSYWISTNKTREQVIKDATDKGIYLKW